MNLFIHSVVSSKLQNPLLLFIPPAFYYQNKRLFTSSLGEFHYVDAPLYYNPRAMNCECMYLYKTENEDGSGWCVTQFGLHSQACSFAVASAPCLSAEI